MEGKVVTANRLVDGVVVYFAAEGDWVEMLADARLAASEDEVASMLADAEEDVARRLVVGPYAMRALGGDTGPLPLSQRERIRAAGPTVHAAYP